MSTILTKPSREYVDIDFLFGRHPITNNVSIKKNVNAVKQSILHLLQIKSGEKPFHPEIKSPVYGYLFENTSVVVKVVLEGEIRAYLGVFEPRVDIVTVEVGFPSPNTISCDITGIIKNIMIPFQVTLLVDRLR